MQNGKEILATLSLPERKILNYFKTENLIKAEETQLISSGKFKDLNEIRSAAGYLQKKGIIKIKFNTNIYIRLLPEGKKYCEVGLPEIRLLKLIYNNNGRLNIDFIEEHGLSDKEKAIGITWLKKLGWADIENIGSVKTLVITDNGRNRIKGEPYKYEKFLEELNSSKDDCLPVALVDEDGRIIYLNNELEKQVKFLKSRKTLIEELKKKIQVYTLTEEGKKCLGEIIEITEELGDLTPEILQTGSWKNAAFRKYRIEDASKKIYIGKLHPLTHLIEKIRKIFLAMGFKEITSDYVRPMFWNMDALFVPQDHPARDAQDTFYVTNPNRIKIENVQLMEKIAQIHQNGGDTGSDGWGYLWNKDEGERACLKTHTTADTIQYLAEHPFSPQKIFIIDTVFRVDKIDRTHLPQFTQIEGIVVEENANIPMLIGIVKEFYRRIGFENVKVKPVYYPFTEPSVHFYTELSDGSILELGGSGIFRPEVTQPLGIKEPVLAWGLGLERLAMNIFGMDSIQDLYLSDIQWLREFVFR